MEIAYVNYRHTVQELTASSVQRATNLIQIRPYVYLYVNIRRLWWTMFVLRVTRPVLPAKELLHSVLHVLPKQITFMVTEHARA